jgi:signal transduction histidine kinase/DNA-binding response OmpR family regulator/ligand-binding sensor domain-containing protein
MNTRISLQLIALFWFILVAINPLVAEGQTFPFKFNYITVDQGLSHTDVNDIVQDNDGFIWVATYFGISRYDGYSIKKYYNENDPKNNAFKNRVRCLATDETGGIWLGTEDGLQFFNARIERYSDYPHLKRYISPPFSKLLKPHGKFLYGLVGTELKQYSVDQERVSEVSLNVPRDVQFTDMAADNNGRLCLSSNKGLWVLDTNQNFTYLSIEGLTGPKLQRVYLDKRSNLLIANDTKLMLLSSITVRSRTDKTLSVAKSYEGKTGLSVKNISQGNKGEYWINTGSSLLRFDQNLSLIQKSENKSSLDGLNSKRLTTMIVDRSECLWVGTFGGGLNYCDLNQKLFFTLQEKHGESNSLSGNHIRSILEDGEDLFIGTNSNGLNRYKFKTKTIEHYNTSNSSVRLKDNSISSLTLDNDHNLWIGSNSGIDILRPNRKELWRPAGYEQFPKFVIETLVKDCYGNIWFGNHSNSYGVIWKDKQDHYHVKYYDEGYFILADERKPQLFVSSTRGLKQLSIDNRGNVLKTVHYTASSKPFSLSSNYTYPISKQNNSNFWIGTIGGGLNLLSLDSINNTYKIKAYTNKQGVFTDVESIEIDNTSNIWMGGNGLLRLDPKTEKIIRYDKNDGLQGNSFKVGSSYHGASGRLYFGGINGLNYFYPEQISLSHVSASPVVTDILINNQKPSYGDNIARESSIEEAPNYSKQLTLDYLQNNFVIFFSSMNYANPLKCRYRYRLEGFDNKWHFTDGEAPSAAYSNLAFGTYTFAVEASNADGIWSTEQARIAITISPPWWKSFPAKTLYGLLIISFLAGIYLYQARWYRLKKEIEVRAIDEKKREEIHQQRVELYEQQVQFFTNISHEFRTPLTLILGPLENLIQEGGKHVDLKNSYKLMLRNSKRLMNLVSELMNFTKVDDSVIKLRVQPLAIDQFCRDIVAEFEDLSIGKNIDFRFIDSTETSSDKLINTFDVHILEKILLNLLNNAFKYTENGGNVRLEIFLSPDKVKTTFKNTYQILNQAYRAEKYLYFKVVDSGIGITGESIDKIFERYYRISRNHLGSGVGLALVKSLTQLHKGDIYVSSERHLGTEIVIGLPWGEENYIESEKVVAGTELTPQLEIVDQSVLLPWTVEKSNGTQSSRSQKRILLVEDNYELKFFLKRSLEKHYQLYEANDGKEALDIATEKIPDLIISDIMMPVMDGIELCKLVKDQFETSHIPFIILSAKDSLNSKIEGLGSGADFYFSKPLNMDLLLLTIKNVFDLHEKMRQKYNNDYLAEVTELVQSAKDKEFLQKLLNTIEENMSDPNLDVNFLCNHLYLSRTKLYQKIKSVTDQSVGEFIRTIRLKKAVQIMTHEDVSMNEIVDRIGLQSNSNFSRAFKKEYGKSPMQYIQMLKKA